MDMNERIAARREELNRQQHAEKVAADEHKEAVHQAEIGGLFEEIFGHAAADGATLKRDKDTFSLDEDPIPAPAATAPLKQVELQRLLRAEARKRWTPKENCLVIGPICAGAVALVLNPFVGLAIVCFGLWQMTLANETHEQGLVDKYPTLFGTAKVSRALRPVATSATKSTQST